MARILLAAPQSGSGKTTVCMGLLRALKAKGLKVQPFKVGPDYIDTAYHTRICERPAINLDGFMMDQRQTKQIFCEYDKNADICVIEGVMGLYDGIGGSSNASSAQVAEWLSAPIIAVIDARGMAATAAAILSGLRDFGPADIRGVIFNKIASDRHYFSLKSAVEAAGFTSLGYMPKDEGLSIPSRHLGILPQSELEEAEAKIERMAKLAAEKIDLDAILSIAKSAPVIDIEALSIQPLCAEKPIRIAVALDMAFNFYYADNLRILERLGAELLFFSPMHDTKLPDCDGVYIGGGFPEVFAAELEKNESMRASILTASQNGKSIYAECGGYIYLMERLQSAGDDKSYAMCGVFPGNAVLGKRLNRHFGYVESELLQDTPIGPAKKRYRNHEFHHSEIESRLPSVYRATKASTGESWEGGQLLRQSFGSYAHACFRGDISLAQNFMRSCVSEGER